MPAHLGLLLDLAISTARWQLHELHQMLNISWEALALDVLKSSRASIYEWRMWLCKSAIALPSLRLINDAYHRILYESVQLAPWALTKLKELSDAQITGQHAVRAFAENNVEMLRDMLSISVAHPASRCGAAYVLGRLQHLRVAARLESERRAAAIGAEATKCLGLVRELDGAHNMLSPSQRSRLCIELHGAFFNQRAKQVVQQPAVRDEVCARFREGKFFETLDALIQINPQDPVEPYDAVIGR